MNQHAFLCVAMLSLLLLPLPSFATEQSIGDLIEKQENLPPKDSEEEEDLFSQVQYLQTSTLVLNVLDKITARVSEIHGQVGKKITFGNLEILPLACYKTSADEKPESVARLRIHDLSKGKDTLIFSGWMFASSPALSVLEHPIYDVWVKACTGTERTPL